MKWSSDGRYILARDYMNLKLWDLNMESAPVATYSVHEHLRAKASSASWHCSSAVTAQLQVSTTIYIHLGVDICKGFITLFITFSA